MAEAGTDTLATVYVSVRATAAAVIVRCATTSINDCATTTTLPSLPTDLLAAVLTACDSQSLGAAACASSALALLCDREGLWAALCRQQGLCVGDDDTPKSTLRRAALCSHTEQWPSSCFVWRRDDRASGGLLVCPHLSCRCSSCGRLYDVTLTTGFMDTSAYASKLVTKAEFRARHAAPSRQQAWSVIWDRAQAAAAKVVASAAEAGGCGGGDGLSSTALAFFGSQPGSALSGR